LTWTLSPVIVSDKSYCATLAGLIAWKKWSMKRQPMALWVAGRNDGNDADG
jgi:hypothetical protein